MKTSYSLLSTLFCLLLLWVVSCKKEEPAVTPGGTTNPGTTTKSSAKAITAFAFSALSPAVTATVDATAKTISATVASATDVTKLVPTITVSDKATVSPATNVVQDFSKAVTYTVTAEDGTTQVYAATVIADKPIVNTVSLFGTYGGTLIEGTKSYPNSYMTVTKVDAGHVVLTIVGGANELVLSDPYLTISKNIVSVSIVGYGTRFDGTASVDGQTITMAVKNTGGVPMTFTGTKTTALPAVDDSVYGTYKGGLIDNAKNYPDSYVTLTKVDADHVVVTIVGGPDGLVLSDPYLPITNNKVTIGIVGYGTRYTGTAVIDNKTLTISAQTSSGMPLTFAGKK